MMFGGPPYSPNLERYSRVRFPTCDVHLCYLSLDYSLFVFQQEDPRSVLPFVTQEVSHGQTAREYVGPRTPSPPRKVSGPSRGSDWEAELAPQDSPTSPEPCSPAKKRCSTRIRPRSPSRVPKETALSDSTGRSLIAQLQHLSGSIKWVLGLVYVVTCLCFLLYLSFTLSRSAQSLTETCTGMSGDLKFASTSLKSTSLALHDTLKVTLFSRPVSLFCLCLSLTFCFVLLFS